MARPATRRRLGQILVELGALPAETPEAALARARRTRERIGEALIAMPRLEPARDQRGSVLLVSLVLIFVMTILGLALFDLGVVESRLVLTSQTDARAFEIAQAGVERALAQLQKDTVDQLAANFANASGFPALCSAGTANRGCSDLRFHPAAPGFISNLDFDSGSYSVEFMQVTAQALSVACNKHPTATSDVPGGVGICQDLIFVRATGTLNGPAGYSSTRTIQLLAQATLTPGKCLICGGLTWTAGTGAPINGNVKVAGSILISGFQGTTSLTMGGGSGQTNSYADLDAASLARVPRLPLVCPIGRTCPPASNLVESLGATLKLARPSDIAAVSLGGGATLGENGDQTYDGDSSRKGKGPLDAIRIADGCTMPCVAPAAGASFTVSGGTLGSSVFVDGNNVTRPYQDPIVPFPMLTASWQVFGVDYDHFACPQGSSCTPPSTPPSPPAAPGTPGSEFFVSRAANVMDLAVCPTCGPIISSLGSTTGLTDTTAAFTATVRFYDQNNQYMKAQICWQRSGVGAPPANTLEFGAAIPDSSGTPPTCDTPAPSSNPLFLYFPSSTPATTGFTVQRVGGPSDYSYRGSAVVMTNGLVKVEERLQTCQTTGAGSACQGHQFTANSSLTLITWGGNSGVCAGGVKCGNMDLGNDTSSASLDRIMGLFYAGCDPADPACGNATTTTCPPSAIDSSSRCKGFLASRKQTNIVGSATGYRLCFAGGSAPCEPGGNVPSFFQVHPDKDNFIAKIGTPGGGSYSVRPVVPYWAECKRAPGDTLPTGLCAYTP